MDRPSERRMRLPKDPSPNRRAGVRFPVTLDVRYCISHRHPPVATGSGRLINLSRSGLRFATLGPLAPGLQLDVAITWPAPVERQVQLEALVTGVVIWSSGTETALQIQRYDYKTRV